MLRKNAEKQTPHLYRGRSTGLHYIHIYLLNNKPQFRKKERKKERRKKGRKKKKIKKERKKERKKQYLRLA